MLVNRGADDMAKRRRSTNTGIPGLSFSAKRAVGITRAKHTIARKTDIPMTKSGRQRKIGKAVTGGGCLIHVISALALAALAAAVLLSFLL